MEALVESGSSGTRELTQYPSQGSTLIESVVLGSNQ